MQYAPNFAPVGPIHTLEYLHENNALGKYQLLLAHDVVAKASRYKKLFKSMREKDPFGCLVIMDNSVVELGKAVDPELIEEAVSLVKTDVIVLPDVMYEKDKTVYSVAEGLNKLSFLRERDPCTSFMAVPQGRTLEEFIQCAEQLSKFNFQYWGVPKHAGSYTGSRTILVRILRTIKSLPVHLLGFSSSLLDDMLSVNEFGVFGIDSAVPIRLGSFKHKMFLTDEHDQRGDWWDNSAIEPEILENVRKVRQWVKNN